MTMTVSLSDQHGDKNEKLTQRIECGLKKEKETLGRDSKVLYSNPGSTANTSLPHTSLTTPIILFLQMQFIEFKLH